MTLSTYAIDEVDADVLAAMLGTHPKFGAVTITDVRAEPVGTGQMAHSYRLHLSGESTTATLPQTVVLKLPSTDPTSRAMAQAHGAYQREVWFYQLLAHRLGVRAPVCWFAEIAHDGMGFALLLEDLSPAATVDQLQCCTAEQAADALLQAAQLHGPSWQQPFLREHNWLAVESIWRALSGALHDLVGPFVERFGDHLDVDHRRVVQELPDHIESWLITLADQRCLFHGDFRLDNLLFEARGGADAVAVVDWQSVAAANGLIDVAYLLGTSLPEAERGQHEHDLVALYHSQLQDCGVRGFAWEQCWTEYRAHAVYGLILTIPASLGVQQTARGDAMFGAMARRTAEQILAHNSFAALQEVAAHA